MKECVITHQSFRRSLRNEEYTIALIVQEDSLIIDLEKGPDLFWTATFNASYLEELTSRTGSFKKFCVFQKMLLRALSDPTSGIVTLGLLEQSDLEKIQSGGEGVLHNILKIPAPEDIEQHSDLLLSALKTDKHLPSVTQNLGIDKDLNVNKEIHQKSLPNSNSVTNNSDTINELEDLLVTGYTLCGATKGFVYPLPKEKNDADKDNRVFLVLVYRNEFDTVFYPLSLQRLSSDNQNSLQSTAHRQWYELKALRVAHVISSRLLCNPEKQLQEIITKTNEWVESKKPNNFFAGSSARISSYKKTPFTYDIGRIFKSYSKQYTKSIHSEASSEHDISTNGISDISSEEFCYSKVSSPILNKNQIYSFKNKNTTKVFSNKILPFADSSSVGSDYVETHPLSELTHEILNRAVSSGCLELRDLQEKWTNIQEIPTTKFVKAGLDFLAQHPIVSVLLTVLDALFDNISTCNRSYGKIGEQLLNERPSSSRILSHTPKSKNKKRDSWNENSMINHDQVIEYNMTNRLNNDSNCYFGGHPDNDITDSEIASSRTSKRNSLRDVYTDRYDLSNQKSNNQCRAPVASYLHSLKLQKLVELESVESIANKISQGQVGFLVKLPRFAREKLKVDLECFLRSTGSTNVSSLHTTVVASCAASLLQEYHDTDLSKNNLLKNLHEEILLLGNKLTQPLKDLRSKLELILNHRDDRSRIQSPERSRRRISSDRNSLYKKKSLNQSNSKKSRTSNIYPIRDYDTESNHNRYDSYPNRSNLNINNESMIPIDSYRRSYTNSLIDCVTPRSYNKTHKFESSSRNGSQHRIANRDTVASAMRRAETAASVRSRSNNTRDRSVTHFAGSTNPTSTLRYKSLHNTAREYKSDRSQCSTTRRNSLPSGRYLYSNKTGINRGANNLITRENSNPSNFTYDQSSFSYLPHSYKSVDQDLTPILSKSVSKIIRYAEKNEGIILNNEIIEYIKLVLDSPNGPKNAISALEKLGLPCNTLRCSDIIWGGNNIKYSLPNLQITLKICSSQEVKDQWAYILQCPVEKVAHVAYKNSQTSTTIAQLLLIIAAAVKINQQIARYQYNPLEKISLANIPKSYVSGDSDDSCYNSSLISSSSRNINFSEIKKNGYNKNLTQEDSLQRYPEISINNYERYNRVCNSNKSDKSSHRFCSQLDDHLKSVKTNKIKSENSIHENFHETSNPTSGRSKKNENSRKNNLLGDEAKIAYSVCKSQIRSRYL